MLYAEVRALALTRYQAILWPRTRCALTNPQILTDLPYQILLSRKRLKTLFLHLEVWYLLVVVLAAGLQPPTDY